MRYLIGCVLISAALFFAVGFGIELAKQSDLWWPAVVAMVLAVSGILTVGRKL